MAVIGSNRYGNVVSTGGASVKKTSDKSYKSKSGGNSTTTSGKSVGPNPNLGSSSSGKSSSKVSSRVIYEDDPNQPGGSIAKTIIDVKGKDVSVKDVKSGRVKTYRSLSNIKASDVSIPEQGIKSYSEQQFEKIDKERVIYGKTETGKNVVRARIQRAGNVAKIEDESGTRYVKLASGKDVEDVSLPYAKSYPEQRYQQSKKTGRFRGSLLEYQEQSTKSGEGFTKVSAGTAKRSGLLVIEITDTTTPREFKQQRDTALSGYGDLVLVETGRPTRIEEGLVNYPPQSQVSTLTAAPKVTASQKIKGKIETGLSQFISKGKYSSFDEIKYAVSDIDVKGGIKEFWNYQSVPSRFTDIDERLLSYSEGQKVRRKELFGKMTSSGLFSLSDSFVNKINKSAYTDNNYIKNQSGKSFLSHGFDNTVLVLKSFGETSYNALQYGKSAVKSEGSRLLGEIIEKPATAGLTVYGYGKGFQLLTKAGLPAYGAVAGGVGLDVALTEGREEKVSRGLFDVSIIGAFAGTSKLKTKVQDVYVAAGSDFVPPESVFAESVLSGKQNLPTTRSIEESLLKFQSGKVSTAAPQKLSSNVAGVGKKAATGFEDPGIYVTPAGEGSPYFLRVKDNMPVEYEFSMNPLKGGIPTVTEFQTAGIGRYPRKIINEPGFYGVSKYQKKILSGSGKGVITKRSEIGLGEIPSRKYQKRDPLTGELLDERFAFERGTSELEAVIPLESQFKYTPQTKLGKFKGFDKYTKYEGRNVAIREAEIIGRSNIKGGIKGEKILKESNYLSESYTKRRVQSVIPSYVKSSGKSVKSYSDQIMDRYYSQLSRGSYGQSRGGSNVRYSSDLSRLYDLESYSSGGSNLRYLVSYGRSYPSYKSTSRSSASSYEKYVSGKSGGVSIGDYGSGKSNLNSILGTRQNKGKGAKGGGYEFVVRIRGKFEVVKNRSYNKLTARSQLARFLEENAAASGYVRKSKRKRSNLFDDYILRSQKRFYSKREGSKNLLIERRGKRISTGGELNQITRLGILSNKKNKRWF